MSETLDEFEDEEPEREPAPDEEQADLFGDDLDDEAILANLDKLDTVDLARWPHRLVEMLEVITSCLMREYKMEREQATRQARDVVATLAKYFGGVQIYLPTSKSLERALRDAKIWSEFTGRNVDELARRYRLTVVQVYNIIARQRSLQVNRVQGKLF